MKNIIIAFLLLMGTACTAAAQPSSQTITRVEESIVTVSWSTLNSEGKEVGSRCTGFVVGIAYAITAAHCTPDDDGTQIYVEGRVSRLLKKDDRFALLSIEPGSRPILTLRKDRLKMGDAVASLGFAMGGPLMTLQRHVASYCGCGFAANDHLIMDGLIIAGMSGGPVIDSDGKVVGLNQAGTPEVGIACPAEEIKEFLK
jgi:serine protease Do